MDRPSRGDWVSENKGAARSAFNEAASREGRQAPAVPEAQRAPTRPPAPRLEMRGPGGDAVRAQVAQEMAAERARRAQERPQPAKEAPQPAPTLGSKFMAAGNSKQATKDKGVERG